MVQMADADGEEVDEVGGVGDGKVVGEEACLCRNLSVV